MSGRDNSDQIVGGVGVQSDSSTLHLAQPSGSSGARGSAQHNANYADAERPEPR